MNGGRGADGGARDANALTRLGEALLMQTSRTSSNAEKLLLLVALVAAWLLWSGLYKPLLLGLGAFSCLLTLYLVYRMGHFHRQAYALNYGVGYVGYLAWLCKEMVLSSLQVSRAVLSPGPPIIRWTRRSSAIPSR